MDIVCLQWRIDGQKRAQKMMTGSLIVTQFVRFYTGLCIWILELLHLAGVRVRIFSFSFSFSSPFLRLYTIHRHYWLRKSKAGITVKIC